VRKPEQVDEMVERTVKHFGGLDILVNNAAGNFICRAEESVAERLELR
jgi:NAD(P)-dependent dehydrogenase (short-subunit alcohol dehydrogenase family)